MWVPENPQASRTARGALRIGIAEARDREVDDVGDVGGRERRHPFVHLVGAGLVALEAHDRELRLDHARLDAGDADAGAREVALHRLRELVNERFRRGIHVTGGTRPRDVAASYPYRP